MRSLLPKLDDAIAAAGGDERLLLRSAEHQVGDDVVVADGGQLRAGFGRLLDVGAGRRSAEHRLLIPIVDFLDYIRAVDGT